MSLPLRTTQMSVTKGGMKMTDVICSCDYCAHILPNGICGLESIDIDGAAECASYEEAEQEE